MSAPLTQYPPLYLWGDLLSGNPKAKRFRHLLKGLLDLHPMLEARHFLPEESSAEKSEGVSRSPELAPRAIQLWSGNRSFQVATEASAEELALIERVVGGIVPEGSAVLAMASAEEDPSDAIRADLPEHGEIILVDPDYRGNGQDLAKAIGPMGPGPMEPMGNRVHGVRPHSLDVVLTAPVPGPSNHEVDGRAIFLALDEDPALLVSLRALRYGSIHPEEDRDFLAQMARAAEREPGDDYIAIHLVPAMQFGPDRNARLNVLRTSCEYDRLPEGLAEHIDQADEIWVPCGQNLRSFHQAGIAMEKLRVIPEAIDSELFDPALYPRQPRVTGAPTRFLSVFDWSERNAPEVLLRAFGRAFGRGEATLSLDIHVPAGSSRTEIQSLAQELCETGARQAGHPSPELHWIQGPLPLSRMPALFAEAEAFVLCSRSAGWSRPLHQAMAMGLPVLTTQHGGAQDLCGARSVAWNIPGRLRPCTPSAIKDEPALEGLSWFEPDEDALVRRLREIHEASDEARARGSRARCHVLSRFHALRVGRLMREAIHSLRQGRAQASLSVGPSARPRPLLLELEGPLFEASSYAGIHRNLARVLQADPSLRVQLKPWAESQGPIPPDLAPLLRRDPRRPDICIRSGWPVLPHRPNAGRWIQRVDWEYGAPPRDLASLLSHGPDEIWVHSRHVERGLIRAGIPEDKIWRLPHGIDPELYHPDRPPLPEIAALTPKCNFLFVGGPIWRKGADLLLQSWLQCFRSSDPARLILRLPGLSTNYADQGLAETFRKAAAHPAAGEILILERDLGDSEMAQLYTSADLLVHPYRGEGFGLPMLEAMACGLPVLATEGGAADDFLDAGTWLRLPAREVEVDIDEDCQGLAWALDPDAETFCKQLLAFPAMAASLRQEACAGAPAIHERFSWAGVARRMLARLRAQNQRTPPTLRPNRSPGASPYSTYSTYSSVKSRSPAATA